MGGIDSWRYSFGVIESWWYFLAVSRVGGIFLAEAVKPNYGGIFSAVIHYGGNVLAVGGFSFFDGNDFDGRRYYQNMAVNRHITGTAHHGGNFTTGKIPTITLDSKYACPEVVHRLHDFISFLWIPTDFILAG